jgi:hypothetical protein
MLAPDGGSYSSESNFFEEDWQHSHWGSNYARLASVKKSYDPQDCSLYTMVSARRHGARTASLNYEP